MDVGTGGGVNVYVRTKIAHVSLRERIPASVKSHIPGVIAVDRSSAIKTYGTAARARGEPRVVVAGRYVGLQKRGDLHFCATHSRNVSVRSELPQLRGEVLQILALRDRPHREQFRGNGIGHGGVARRYGFLGGRVKAGQHV